LTSLAWKNDGLAPSTGEAWRATANEATLEDLTRGEPGPGLSRTTLFGRLWEGCTGVVAPGLLTDDSWVGV
jgi:hypothetical protein